MNFKLSNCQTIVVLSIFILLTTKVIAQKAPMKFGKVEKADLEMKVFPADSSAVAAILCNYGRFDATSFQFTRMLRIKILKKEGEEWSNRVFPTSSKSDIRGITFNLENGEIVESKLKSESIFKEKVTEDYVRLRVAMPNVKEGSVIDLMFTYSGFPDEWRFQEEIPVRWSELIIEPSSYFSLRKNFFGYQSLAERSDMRWVAKDVPAFKTEPYINSISNYITKFEIDVLNISYPGYYKEFTTTWNAVETRLIENTYFGQALKGGAFFLNSIAKEIETKYSTPSDKLRAAYETIKKIKWNEEEALYTTNNTLSSAFTKKIGNSADINLMLVLLLKKLDFEAYPVAMSTRSNGVISIASPSMNRLNYTIACAKIDGANLLLDATEELMPLGLLPERCINSKGRIIDDKKPEWVDLSTTKKDKKTIVYDLKLEPDNLLTGKIMTSRIDYAAFNFRKKYGKFNSQDEYLKNFEKDNSGLIVLNAKIDNIDSIYKPLQEEYTVKIKNKVSLAGDLLYINPMLYEQIAVNPFKLEKREYPVDFSYPIEETYIFKLTLPDGYQVSDLPKPLMIKLSDNSASCIYKTSATGNLIQVTYKLVINKPIYLVNQYADLRSFFTELIKKEAESIVLKNK